MYRQQLSGHGLSIEQLTPRVPNDGHYYVLLHGCMKGRFKSLNQALKLYGRLKNEIGYEPPPPPEQTPLGQVRLREMEAQSNKSLLWTDEDFVRVDRKTRRRPKHGGRRA